MPEDYYPSGSLSSESKKSPLLKYSLVAVISGLIVTPLLFFAYMRYFPLYTNWKTPKIEPVDEASFYNDLSLSSNWLQYDTNPYVTQQRYYSPILKALITYNPKVLKVTEDIYYDGISLTSATRKKYNWEEYGGVYRIKAPDDETFHAEIKKGPLSIRNVDTGARTYEFVQTQKDGDFITLQYRYKNAYSNEKLPLYWSMNFLGKKMGDDYYYVQYQSLSQLEWNTLLPDFTSVLQSIDTNPQGIDQVATTALPGIGMSVIFDRDTWGMNMLTEGQAEFEYLKGEQPRDSVSLRFQYYLEPTSSTMTPQEELLKELDFKIDSVKGFNNFKQLPNGEFRSKDGKQYATREYTASHTIITNPKHTVSTYTKMYGTYLEKQHKFLIIALFTSVDAKRDPVLLPRELPGIVEAQNLIDDVKQNLDSVLGTSTSGVDKGSILGKSAVVRLYSNPCVTTKISPSATYLTTMRGKSFTSCVGYYGSGFYANNNGTIISNAHVVSPNPEDVAIDDLLLTAEQQKQTGFWPVFAGETAQFLALKNVPVASDTEFATYVVAFFFDNIKNKDIDVQLTPRVYVQGETPFKIDAKNQFKLTNASAQFETKVLHAERIASMTRAQFDSALGKGLKPVGILVPDVAVIQVTTPSDYPSLLFANPSLISAGQEINAIGFPASADNKELFSDDSSAVPTLTRGTISAVKPSRNNTFKLIQFDASISQGNSGGPVLNRDGEVVGVATYGVDFSGSADFNAGVSIESVQAILTQLKVENRLGGTSTHLGKAISFMEKEYYKLALPELVSAERSHKEVASTTTVLKNIANDRIKKGEDKSPLFFVGGAEVRMVQVIVVGGVILLIIVLIIFMVLRSIRKKKNKGPTVPSTPVPPVQSPQPIQLAQSTASVPPVPPIQPTPSTQSIQASSQPLTPAVPV